jgi:sterol desaturase/sphingolipid hydroxylase (fatty acid hydroxylase superfamily)
MKEYRLYQKALVWGAYPALVFGSLALAIPALERAWLPAEQTGTIALVGVGALIIVLELLMPDRPRRATPRMIWTDLLHNVLSAGLVSTLVRAGLFAAFLWLATSASAVVGAGLWPTQWPLALQLVVAAILGELGNYWMHRLFHRVDVLWRVNALHHSPAHLYLLASGRSHPINAALVHVTQVAPAILLGASPELVALLAVFTAVTGLLQHCNAEMRTEWLNWLIATPDLHRIHHSTNFDESNTNFGNNLMIWDIVFRTWRPGPPPVAYGVPGVAWPETYLGQLASPFIYERLTKEEAAPAE